MSATAPLRRRALVTGASGAIGQAIAERLGRDGVHVIAHANGRLDAASAVVARIVAAGGSGEAVAFDVTDADGARAACERLLADGAIQIVVNNAGVHDDAVFPGMRAEQWHRVIDVSLNGFFNVTQPLVMAMMRTRWGRIVNVSSVAALTGNRGQVELRGGEGRDQQRDQGARARAGEPRRHGQRGRARDHRFRDGRGDVRSRDDRDSWCR